MIRKVFQIHHNLKTKFIFQNKSKTNENEKKKQSMKSDERRNQNYFELKTESSQPEFSKLKKN